MLYVWQFVDRDLHQSDLQATISSLEHSQDSLSMQTTQHFHKLFINIYIEGKRQRISCSVFINDNHNVNVKITLHSLSVRLVFPIQ